jgi:large subunit ribosomal protein L25
MKSVSLNADPRTNLRRNKVKKLRREGRLPAVIYGRQRASQSVAIRLKDIEHVIHHSLSENVLVDLSLKDDQRPKRLALVKDVQHHPLTGDVLHVDFQEVAEDEKVTMVVPVESVGDAVGVKTGGGLLEHVLFKLKVRALPKDLPELIQVDVTNLNVGETIHIGDIPPPSGVEILGDPQIPVLSVAAQRVEITEEAPVAGSDQGAAAA